MFLGRPRSYDGMVGFGVFLFLFFGMPGRNLKKMAQHCCVVAGEEDKECHF